MRAAGQAGVKIGMGSDRGGVGGDDAALELLRMIHHGLPVIDALRSATSVAAQAIGLEEDIGTVQRGRLADLVVVDGDVLAKPELLRDPHASGRCSSWARSWPAPRWRLAPAAG